MKLRTGLLVLALAVFFAWVMPSVRTESRQSAHEFLMSPAQAVAAAHHEPGVQPIQLALLFQTSSR